ncbi:lysophospholipase [Salipiger aestuarii]|uniref:DUF1489 family protein n=1 Tax=Salipiger aestuarii TaxID=568098 RepID=A0A327YDQ8_9RHOB|nr:DUF1489 domain-containing protein [Salipiger aestuarii]KAB2542496.1 lysophospholipase [Salipiger aestuarii]RAK18964.1 hypothetical protein ATI53_10106 [Salipiger aestuarii]
MTNPTHLIKLSVGTESVEGLAAWQASPQAQTDDGQPRHVTRMFPKREADVLDGGSIYWVFQGLIQCRQRVLRLDRVTGSDGITRCAMVLDQDLIRVSPAQRRPFQGWRYLAPADAPPDLAAGRQNEDSLPPELAGALAEIGVL